MNNFIKKEEIYLLDVIKNLGYEVSEVSLVVSKIPGIQYQYNGAMQIAKKLGVNPRIVAEKIVEELKNKDNYSDVSIGGVGFVNISFSDKYIIDYMNLINNDISINKCESKDKKIIIDYGGANVSKALHVGHLRSAIIGEALKRLSTYLGCEVYGDSHLGDWGRPLGLVLTEIKERYPNLNYFDPEFNGEYGPLPVTNEDLEIIYPVASIKAKENETYMEEARKITTQIQEGVPGIYDLWKDVVNISKIEIKKIYDFLNVTFEFWYGESDAEKYIPDLTKYLKDNNYTYLDQGAYIIDVSLPNDNSPMPPVLYIKSNGALSYEATDLATIWGHMKETNPDEMWYVTDQRQQLHFEQVFRSAYKSKIVSENKNLEFIGFGTMNGPDGKPFKTRDGGTMKLIDLIEGVKQEVIKNIGDNITDKENLANKIALACLKYADFSSNRASDYIFDPVKFTDLNGKTGVYILYSNIRMKSLLNKANETNINYNDLSVLDEIDRSIALKILEVPKILETSYNTKSLNLIVDFLYEVCNLFNNMYANNKILTEEDMNIRESRLILTNIVYQTTTKLIDVLGIEIPDRM